MLTRDAAIEVLTAVICAPITRTIRDIRSEVEVGLDEGLPEASAISCDNVLTLPKWLLDAIRSVILASQSAPISTKH